MKKEIVASGRCVITEGRKACLEAYLGSCVGLSVIDREAGVGGMIHLLLPEPSGTDIPFEREIYATTGVPYFLEMLFDAGASKERAEACVGGGAFIGRVSGADLSLDIGGRTAERVQEYLNEQEISVKQSETGGYVGRKMSLDLWNWGTAIEPVWQLPEYSKTGLPVEESLDIEKAIYEVKPIPQVALKIIRMIQLDAYSMGEVGREIRQDQVISGRVLNLCNSAMMGLRTQIESIDRAVVVLGEKQLLKLVISASLESLFPYSPQGYSLCKGGLFQHALGTAMISQEIASFTGRAPPDIAYTAGLLHDIGKIPLDQFLAADAPYFYRKVSEEDTDLCTAEKTKFGIDHTEAGRRLGSRWNLPRNLINAISYHHCPEDSEGDEDLVTLVYLADLLMTKFQANYEVDRIGTERLPERLARLGLSPSQFLPLIDRIPRNIFQEHSAHLFYV